MRALKAFIKSILNVLRAKRFDRAVQSGELNGQLLILMYHRVLPKSDPRLENEEPGMYVTPETLDMHLSELKKISTLIHIEDWLDLAKNDKLDDMLYCAITFDDGWADNYEFALPLLKKHSAPATVFLATDYIDSNTTFWPERLAALLNNFEQCSDALTSFFQPLGQTLDYAKLRTKNKDYFAHLINAAKALTDDDIKDRLNDIEAQMAIPSNAEMLNWVQAKELLTSNVRIGGHTRSHMRLNDKISAGQITHEVKGCALDIETHLGIKPTQFCYPNGDTTSESISEVKKNFELAVTTQQGLNQSNSQPFTLRRIGVHEDASHTILKLKSVLSSAASTGA